VPYDELTHAFATFSVSLAFYFLFYRGAVPRERALALGTSVFTLGVTIGAYWEVFEWVMGNRFGMQDTMTDLIVDSIGALVAAFVVLVLQRRGESIT
jgi:VanZ family protein